MHATTEAALRAIMRTDETIAREQEEAAIRAGKGTPTNPEPLPAPMVSPTEACKLFGNRDRHTLAAWEKRGWLVAVRTGAKGRNIVGYTGESVRALLAGKPLVNGKAVA